MAKQRIAILGGGMAGLTAAFEITSALDWKDHFELTVYQLGWRLGGKGASARNPEQHGRIEEHGLHILLGFYDNAFRILKACYAELGRPPGAPMATWRDAFKPHDYVVLMDKVGDCYSPWPSNFMPNSDEPGTGGVLPTPMGMIQTMLGWLKQLFRGSQHLPDSHPALDDAHAHAAASDHHGLLGAIHALGHWIRASVERIEHDLNWRRMFVTIDLAVATIKGLIVDRVIFAPHDFFKLDTLDFAAWLTKHGAHEASVKSGYIASIYDLGFTLPGNVGAGSALNGILRLMCTYKGSVMWKMQAGMGDTIFAPLYEVLARRGVRFEFFQRVDKLELSDDKRRVARVIIGQQATLRGGYDPLVTIDGLPCWPHKPRYDQLNEGDALRASGENLEDWWTAWQDPVAPRVLRDGVDYDRVILACSVGVFPYIAADLMAASPPLAAMVAAVGTTQTQAVQLWLSRDLAEMGWALPSPVLDGFEEPFDTWADMSFLLEHERWPADAQPRHLAYLCSPMPDDAPPPPRSEHGYAQRQAARVREHAIGWLTQWANSLWPKACHTDHPFPFDWSTLVAPGSTATGPARFDTQYYAATLNPSDRYVLALPNTVDKRLGSAGAGFDNLLLAGDYLRTGLNVGCVEAAVMGGMHASRAVCGRPEQIVGDDT